MLEYSHCREHPVGCIFYGPSGTARPGCSRTPYAYVEGNGHKILVDVGHDNRGSEQGVQRRQRHRRLPVARGRTGQARGDARGDRHGDPHPRPLRPRRRRPVVPERHLLPPAGRSCRVRHDGLWTTPTSTPRSSAPSIRRTSRCLRRWPRSPGRLQLLDGPVENLFPGLHIRTAWDTHTPGGQYAVVDRPRRETLGGDRRRPVLLRERRGHRRLGGSVTIGFGGGSGWRGYGAHRRDGPDARRYRTGWSSSHEPTFRRHPSSRGQSRLTASHRPPAEPDSLRGDSTTASPTHSHHHHREQPEGAPCVSTDSSRRCRGRGLGASPGRVPVPGRRRAGQWQQPVPPASSSASSRSPPPSQQRPRHRGRHREAAEAKGWTVEVVDAPGNADQANAAIRTFVNKNAGTIFDLVFPVSSIGAGLTPRGQPASRSPPGAGARQRRRHDHRRRRAVRGPATSTDRGMGGKGAVLALTYRTGEVCRDREAVFDDLVAKDPDITVRRTRCASRASSRTAPVRQRLARLPPGGRREPRHLGLLGRPDARRHLGAQAAGAPT